MINLHEKVKRAAALLETNGAIQNKSSLTKFTKNLEKALDEFLKNSEPELFRSTPQYVELAALIDLPENKAIVTRQWFDKKAETIGRKFSKFTKKEKDELVVELVKAKKADATIEELKTTPQKRAQLLFSEIANQSESQAKAQIEKMKPKGLEEFCQHNEIRVERNKKGGFDKKKTVSQVLKQIQTVRDYLNL